MKNLFFLIAFFALTTQSFSQVIEGYVVDSLNEPIPYCYVSSLDSKTGTLTNEKGCFAINIKGIDSLQISFMGYITKQISIEDLQTNNTIKLTPNVVQLNSFTVKAKRDKTTTIQFAKHNRRFVSYPILPYSENAFYFPNKQDYQGYIKNLKMFIVEVGTPFQPFKINLYDVDLLTGFPNNELIQGGLTIQSDTSDEWLSINLDTFRIAIPKEGFFVSLKSLPVKKNLDTRNHSKYQKDSISKRNKFHNKTGHNLHTLYIGADYKTNYQSSISCTRMNNGWQKHRFSKQLKGRFYNVPAIKVGINYHTKKKLFGQNKENLDYKRVKVKKRKVKYDKSTYPHSTVRELFESNLKAIKNDDIAYLFKYLYVLKKENKAILMNELQERNWSLNENEKKEAVLFFEGIISNLDKASISKITNTIYELHLPNNQKITLLKKSNNWYAYPYTDYTNFFE